MPAQTCTIATVACFICRTSYCQKHESKMVPFYIYIFIYLCVYIYIICVYIYIYPFCWASLHGVSLALDRIIIVSSRAESWLWANLPHLSSVSSSHSTSLHPPGAMAGRSHPPLRCTSQGYYRCSVLRQQHCHISPWGTTQPRREFCFQVNTASKSSAVPPLKSWCCQAHPFSLLF